ncbi:MAG TPA: hypothetical protein VFA18_14250 [Gemmataceae bacterium]|nr:hypothetical protein [Gemmataceae bacterium]
MRDRVLPTSFLVPEQLQGGEQIDKGEILAEVIAGVGASPGRRQLAGDFLSPTPRPAPTGAWQLA